MRKQAGGIVALALGMFVGASVGEHGWTQTSVAVPKKATVEELLKLAKDDNELVIRLAAVDRLEKLAAGIRASNDASLIRTYSEGLEELWRNYPKASDTKLCFDERVHFRVHVLHALSTLGAGAIHLVPELVKTKGQDSRLDKELEIAMDAIMGTATTQVPAPELKPDAAWTTVTFQAKTVAAGSEVGLEIVALDAGKSPLPGLKKFTFAIAGGRKGTFTKVSEGKGTYHFKFKGETADPDTDSEVSVTIDDVPIKNKATIRVTPGSVSRSKSTVSPSRVRVVSGGKPATFTIEVKDEFENVISGAKVEVKLEGVKPISTGVFGSVSEAKKKYTVDFTGNGAGLPAEMEVRVTASDGKTVLLDFRPKITVGAGAVGGMSSAKFASTKVSSGEPVEAIITLKDAKNNPVHGLGDEQFGRPVLSEPSVLTEMQGVTEVFSGSGIYKIVYMANKAGATTLTVTVDGQTFTTAKLTVVPGQVSGTKSDAEFSNEMVAVKGTVTLEIVVKDAAENLVMGLQKTAFDLRVVGASQGTFGTVKESGNKGTYTVVFTGVTAGAPSSLIATVNGVPIITKTKIQVQ